MGGSVKGYILKMTACFSICAMITGCNEQMADGISTNQEVIKNMTSYMQSVYGVNVNIEHTILKGGSDSGRVYVAEIQENGEYYLLEGSYDSDGRYKETTDTILNKVTDKAIDGTVQEVLKNAFTDFDVCVSSDIKVDNSAKFGNIPSYEDIVKSGKVLSESSINIIGVVYCDTKDLKNELGGKTKYIKDILDNAKISTNISLFLVDKKDYVNIHEYLKENDLESLVALYNSGSKSDIDIDCCKGVIRCDSEHKDEMADVGLYSYIQTLSKDSKDNK